MRLGWLSDIHLNFLDAPSTEAFLNDVASRPVDAWLLGGDIGEARTFADYLRRFEAAVLAPALFVLGNHDSYGSSIAATQAEARALTRESDRLTWLTDADALALGEDLAVVGDDGWADARFGDARGTPVELNDFFLIRELAGLPRPVLIRTMESLGDAAAERLAPKLRRAARTASRVVVLTHVPPFREAAWHQGRPSGDDFLPWFSSRAMGEAILDCASAHPSVRFLVLCGHTHGAGTCSPATNVTVHTGGAEYGAPRVQALLDFNHGAWPVSAPLSGTSL